VGIDLVHGHVVEPVFSKEFQVRNYEVDARGCLSPLVLLNLLQEAAGVHARQLGVAVTDLNRQGCTWVLSRLHLQIRQLPRSGSAIALRTWPSSREGLFSCREFEICSAVGEILALATSSWAVIDLVTRRPQRLDTCMLPYSLDPRRALTDQFTTLPAIDRVATRQQFTVRRSDLDLNRHVNNVAYAGWLLETVPEKTYTECRLESIEIGFRAEAFAGEEVVATCGPQADEAGCFLHQIRAVSDDRELVRARTRWVPELRA
jgi:medium-chain acyl-[acyl-carrier-protein] hydrolase